MFLQPLHGMAAIPERDLLTWYRTWPTGKIICLKWCSKESNHHGKTYVGWECVVFVGNHSVRPELKSFSILISNEDTEIL